jgi:hypothetical protein
MGKFQTQNGTPPGAKLKYAKWHSSYSKKDVDIRASASKIEKMAKKQCFFQFLSDFFKSFGPNHKIYSLFEASRKSILDKNNI